MQRVREPVGGHGPARREQCLGEHLSAEDPAAGPVQAGPDEVVLAVRGHLERVEQPRHRVGALRGAHSSALLIIECAARSR